MKVKMKNTESGRHPECPNGQFHCLEGHEYDVPDDLAIAWTMRTPPIATKVKTTKTKKETNHGD